MQSANPITAPSDDAYVEAKSRRPKRRKTNTGKAAPVKPRATRMSTSLLELLDVFRQGLVIRTALETENSDVDKNRHEIECQNENDGFESTMEGLLAEYLGARQALWAQSSRIGLPEDNKGAGGKRARANASVRRPVSKSQGSWSWRDSAWWDVPCSLRNGSCCESCSYFKRDAERVYGNLFAGYHYPHHSDPQYEHSFTARVYGQWIGNRVHRGRCSWMTFTTTTPLHRRDQPERPRTPITYVFLQPSHLSQVHELLTRIFWEGIDDALHYTRERCTVITMFGNLIVSVTFLSSPQETYITYLAVRAGWENAQIATTMLHHLIALHPYRDITLHVSANNPAMLLYNRFGFKAKEFVAGFYDAYLDTQSTASKNACLLRLRR